MNAATLTILADATDILASIYRDEEGASETANYPLRNAAQDARREVRAANGMGTKAGLMWSVCVMNDRETAETIAAMVKHHAPSETARADLADALKSWTENDAGTEGVNTDGGEVVGCENGDAELSPLILTMIRSAIMAIDWHVLAVRLLDEYAEEA